MEDSTITSRSGVKLPRLVYGTAWKKEKTTSLVEQAIQTGFRGIDTACQPKHYREDLVGAALASMQDQGISRSDIFLQTKFTPVAGQDPQNIPYNNKHSLTQQVLDSFEVSKKNLKTDYVDSLVLHSPYASTPELMEVWQAMEEIVAKNGARQIGISNCYDLKVLKYLEGESRVKPAVVQNRFYQDTGYDQGIRQFCSDHQIIYQSFWTLTANPHILESNPLTSLAKKYDSTTVQILFNYLSLRGIVPLTGTCNQAHMEEDLKSFEFSLDESEAKIIDTVFTS